MVSASNQTMWLLTVRRSREIVTILASPDTCTPQELSASSSGYSPQGKDIVAVSNAQCERYQAFKDINLHASRSPRHEWHGAGTNTKPRDIALKLLHKGKLRQWYGKAKKMYQHSLPTTPASTVE
jgi:hypothetical protein